MEQKRKLPIHGNQIFNIAAFIPIIFGLLCAVFLLYVFFWPMNQAYEVTQVQNHKVTYENDSIRIHREYCINAEIPIRISRDLIRIGDRKQPEERINLPETEQIYKVGCHSIDRIFEVPDTVRAGTYRLSGVATWQANPFRSEMAALPELILHITH